jgi:hypothetical protein
VACSRCWVRRRLVESFGTRRVARPREVSGTGAAGGEFRLRLDCADSDPIFSGRALGLLDVIGALRTDGASQLLLLLIVLSLVVVATSNAVNLTDGIDGLARPGCAGRFAFCCAALSRAGRDWFNQHDFLDGASGACLGF